MNLNPIDCAAYYDRLILQIKCKIPDDCAICLDTLVNKNVIYLPCKHYFHSNCIKRTFVEKIYTCPLCRHNLMNSLQKIGHIFNEEIENEVWHDFSYIYYYYTRAGTSEAGTIEAGTSEAGTGQEDEIDNDADPASALDPDPDPDPARIQSLEDNIRTYYDDLMIRNYIIYYVL